MEVVQIVIYVSSINELFGFILPHVKNLLLCALLKSSAKFHDALAKR